VKDARNSNGWVSAYSAVNAWFEILTVAVGAIRSILPHFTPICRNSRRYNRYKIKGGRNDTLGSVATVTRWRVAGEVTVQHLSRSHRLNAPRMAAFSRLSRSDRPKAPPVATFSRLSRPHRPKAPPVAALQRLSRSDRLNSPPPPPAVRPASRCLQFLRDIAKKLPHRSSVEDLMGQLREKQRRLKPR
jgi:hypothetical protein